MFELMLLYLTLGLSWPLATYSDGNRWRVWTRNQATVPLWDLVGFEVLVPGEYALRRGGIGGATRLAAEIVSVMKIQHSIRVVDSANELRSCSTRIIGQWQ